MDDYHTADLENVALLHSDCFEIVIWTPDESGRSSGGEQVHLVMHIAPDLHLVTRLQTRDAVNVLIKVLEEQRDEAHW